MFSKGGAGGEAVGGGGGLGGGSGAAGRGRAKCLLEGILPKTAPGNVFLPLLGVAGHSLRNSIDAHSPSRLLSPNTVTVWLRGTLDLICGRSFV